MGLAIRRASRTEDWPELLEVFKQNFGDGYFGDGFEHRFEWHNTLNPAGQGWTWILYDQNDKSVFGTTSVFPRNMYVDGKQLAAGQVMFFAVSASHRSLGPAVMLQRATLDPVDRGELAFCYDCPPHNEGMSTFARMGMRPRFEMIRYVLPLRSDEYVHKRVGTGAWTKSLVSTANLLLRMRRPYRNIPGIEISKFDGAFGDEFSHLDKLVSSSGVIRARRSAEFLNWFFRRLPSQRKCPLNGKVEVFQALVARRRGELQAFAIYSTQDDKLIAVADLFGVQLAELGRALLEAVVEIGRRDKMLGVYACLSERGELRQIFRGAGFHPRERCARVVTYEKPDGRHLNSGLCWAFNQVELML